MFVLGLTGSIGMGKSTAARMLRCLGCPVHDADRAVHELLNPGGRAAASVAARFPGCLDAKGGVDRKKLGAQVFGDADKLKALEAILHPLVHEAERRFLDQARAGRRRVAVLDIPLLFETHGEARCHAVAVVTAPAFVQRGRVLARPGMTEEKFRHILSRQTPDGEKRARADWLLPTGLGKRFTYRRIKKLLAAIRGY